MSALAELAELLSAQGGLLGAVVHPPDGDAALPGGPAGTAVAGPRIRARAREYALLLEAIYEGYLLHYGGARVVRSDDDDLRLLAGDRLYALGLARLVALGDLDAVAELADVISLSAVAQAGGDRDLADAVWAAGARAVGWGAGSAHARAKALARTGDPHAVQALTAAAQGG